MVGVVGGVLGTVAKAVLGGGKPKAAPTPTPLPVAQVRTASVVADALSRRRGSAANQRTGSGGAESSAGQKKTLLGT